MINISRLRQIEVYDYYDQSLLFSCIDEHDLQRYLAIWVDRKPSGDVWLYAPVTIKELEQLVAKAIPIRKLFQEAKGGWVYNVLKRSGNPRGIESYDIEPITCGEIPEEWLSVEGVTL